MFVGSCVIAFFAVTRLAEPVQSSQFFPDFSNPPQVAFTAVSVIDFVMAIFLPKLFLNGLSRLRDKPDAEAQARNTYFVSRIISWSIAISITMMGFALTVMIHSNRIVLPFLAISWLSLFMNRADEENFKQMLRKHQIAPNAQDSNA
jgi:hypothetical protein